MLSAFLFCISLLFASASAAFDDGSAPIYKNADAPIEDRVEDLLSRMSIQEKTSQLVQGDLRNWMDTTDGKFNASGLRWSMEQRSGQFYVYVTGPDAWQMMSEGVRMGQEYLVHNTTLGIPAWVQTEGIHGFLVPNATIFNSPIAHACSFNPALVEKMARAIAQEALALGVNNIFAPVVDLARELRFGRVEETYGEDPYLAGELGYAYVKGLQSGNVSAMVKHYRAIMDAGATSIMSAYSSYDGVPAVADKYLLTDILRNEWGYKYYVISDAGATDRLCNPFGMCESDPIDSEAVVRYALPAGNDVEMGGGSYNFEKIPQMVESGKLSLEIIDEAVRRQLRAKFALGLFENPYPGKPKEEWTDHINTPETIQLARQLDAESIVLLENHDNVLPLSRDANIAVIGPMAHGYMNYGDYVPAKASQRGVTPLDGIKAATKGTVTYTQGCERWSSDQSGIPDAVAAAQAADVAVVVVGTWSRDQDELWAGLNATTGEHVDVHSLNLPGAMPHLVRAVVDSGTPTVVVFSSGKPVTEAWISEAASALVQQFYPSEQGGHALADILFGATNPSGRLSVSFPHDIGTTPIYYDHLNSGRQASDPGAQQPDGSLTFGHSYVLQSAQPLYEFGYGLSYSVFEYANLQLSLTAATASDTVSVSVDVTNGSERDGADVVQVYVRDVVSSVEVANRRLRGFAKVVVRAGETVTVRVDLRVADLGLWDVNMEYVVEPGAFVVMVGRSSLDLRGNATFTVV